MAADVVVAANEYQMDNRKSKHTENFSNWSAIDFIIIFNKLMTEKLNSHDMTLVGTQIEASAHGVAHKTSK